MSTDPSTTEQIAAAVLAEHVYLWGYATCSCGIPLTIDDHRAHVAQQIAARLDDGLRAGVEALADEKESHFCRSMCGADAHRDDPDGCELMLISPAELRALLDQTRTENGEKK